MSNYCVQQVSRYKTPLSLSEISGGLLAGRTSDKGFRDCSHGIALFVGSSKENGEAKLTGVMAIRQSPDNSRKS